MADLVRFLFCLVFRNRSNRKEYPVSSRTDTTLTEDEIIPLYGKQWDSEVFFKPCKSALRLTGESRSLSYGAMCAQCAVVFAQYRFLAVGIRYLPEGIANFLDLPALKDAALKDAEPMRKV